MPANFTDRRSSERRTSAQIPKKDRELFTMATLLEGAIEGRDKASQALSQSEARYRALFQATKDCVIIVNDAYVVMEANPSVCQVLKATLNRVIGHAMSEFFPPDLLESSVQEFQEFKNKGYWEGRWPVRALDGTVVPMEWRATANFLPGLHFTIGRQPAR